MQLSYAKPAMTSISPSFRHLSYAQPAVTQQQSTGYQLTVKDFFQQV